MTPKEKAQKLVDNYKPIMYCFVGSGMLTNSFNENEQLKNAKFGALMLVNEVLDVVGHKYQEVDYWERVKTEIEKL